MTGRLQVAPTIPKPQWFHLKLVLMGLDPQSYKRFGSCDEIPRKARNDGTAGLQCKKLPAQKNRQRNEARRLENWDWRIVGGAREIFEQLDIG